ncbi:MAG: c-type cytochrome [Thiotrichales bacterium]
MKRTPWLLIFLVLAAVTSAVLFFAATPPRVVLHDEVERSPAAEVAAGEYLVRLAGCAACHTDNKTGGQPFAGGSAFPTAYGTFYAPNITPDPATGIGRWSEEDLGRALRYGIAPGGHAYYPVFPYTAYTDLSDDDLGAIYAYLMTVTPVSRVSKAHVLPWYLTRATARAWQMAFFRPGRGQFTHSTDTLLGRGEYLAKSVAHCGECHTPRNTFGALKRSYHLAGVTASPVLDGKAVPNITRAFKGGIGKWGAADLKQFFQTGQRPEGKDVGGAMAEVIDGRLKYLSPEDSKALVTYIRSVPEAETLPWWSSLPSLR